MKAKRNRLGLRTPMLTHCLVVAMVLVVQFSSEAQQRGETVHEAPLPQITTGGQSDWPLHNLDERGSRYAEIDQINTSNVSDLDLSWSFEAGAANSITQVTPIVVDGVMYLNAGSKLFALNAITGETVWTMTLNDNLESRGRGPTYGDGRLYAFGGASMYATDGKTGELVDSFGDGGRLEIVSEALEFKYPDDYPPGVDAYSLGYRLTTPPVYHEGTLYAGVALSENQIPGGLVIASDATTGEIKWVFNTVPQGPRDDGWELAKDTWGEAEKMGGGIWTPPAIDAELGLIYINAGNPSPDYDGSSRPGQNLFTNATIALDLETGRLVWFYQAVHHDLWDFDHVSGPMLFDVEQDGQMVKGVAAAGKNCLMYFWDRETGEPLNPMVETAMPTASDVPGEQVWPTQSIPYNARGVPMTPLCATFPVVADPEARQRARQIYTPYSTQDFYIVAHGGSSWGPPSFSESTGLVYITGKDGAVAFTVNPVGDTMQEFGQGDGHADLIADGPIRDDMVTLYVVSAYEPVSGEMVWQQTMPTMSAIGASGNLATSGDLVLQATDLGEIYALDARTGEQLFLYKHNRPIRASPLTYEVNGKQYISVVSTNNVLTFALPE